MEISRLIMVPPETLERAFHTQHLRHADSLYKGIFDLILAAAVVVSYPGRLKTGIVPA